MSKMMKAINKLNFKKAAIIYLIISALLVISCIMAAAYVMRDELRLAFDYNNIHEKVKRYGINDDIKSSLNKLASDFDNINNVIIVDKNNNILYKNNSKLIGENAKFQLTPYQSEKRYFQDGINPNIIYKAVKENNFTFSKEFLQEIKTDKDNSGYSGVLNRNRLPWNDNDISFASDITSKEVKILNYIVDYESGNKIFIIRDRVFIPYAERAFELIGFILIFIFSIYWIGLALWVYKDANGKNINAPLWGLLVLVTNFVGLITYTIVKQNSRICPKCGVMQDSNNLFCVNCGEKINEFCSNCNTIISNGENYCSKCGDKLRK